MSELEARIRPFHSGDREGCAEVFATLGDWFAIPEANTAYLDGLAELPSWVAEADGRIVGFASLRTHASCSVEIEVLAVERDRHRGGIGRRLVGALESEIARRPDVTLFHVKTRGPSQPDAGYERTRRFYEALGFQPLFETEALWGPQDPALVMVRPVRPPLARPGPAASVREG